MDLASTLISFLFITQALCLNITLDLMSQDDRFYSFSKTAIHNDKAYFIGVMQYSIWEYDPDTDLFAELPIQGSNIYDFLWNNDLIYFMYDQYTGTKFGKYDPSTNTTTPILVNSTQLHSLVALDSQNLVCFCQGSGPAFTCYNTQTNTMTDVSTDGMYCTSSSQRSALSYGGDIYITMNKDVGFELYRWNPTDGWRIVGDMVSGSSSSTPSNTFVFQNNVFFSYQANISAYFLVKFDPTANTLFTYPTALFGSVYRSFEFENRLYFGITLDFSVYYLASLSLASPDLELVTAVRVYALANYENSLLMIAYPNGTYTPTVMKLDTATNTTEVVYINNSEWNEPNVNGDLFIQVKDKFLIQDYDMDLAPNLGRLFGKKGSSSTSGNAESEESSSGLSNGAISGIVIGGVAVAGCCVGALIFVVLRRRKHNEAN